MGRFKKMMEISSNIGGYIGDEGEPDTGFIRGEKKRRLGVLAGKPEPWFERGGYKQVDFPKADYIYGKGEEEDFTVRKTAYISQIDKEFEAHFEKWEDWVADKDYETQNTLKESNYKKIMGSLLTEIKIKVLSGHLTAKDKKIVKQMLDRKMDSGRVGKADYFIKNLGKDKYEITQRMMDAGIGIGARKVLRNYKSKIQVKEGVILERMDFMDTAKQLVKHYGLKSKIKMGTGKNFGEYVPETDTITLRPSYKSTRDFLMTILHEIGHALDAKRIGVKKYIKKYTQAGTMAAYDGLDPHDDNKWEEKAEKFAKREISRWI
tara:strand:+ start:9683 stop:10642 length:960 start_codon:yes stop_codon:yes gene_type:complete